LSALPDNLIADEAAVGNAVRTLMASVLAVRHPRRLMSVASPTTTGGEDATCVFRDSVDYSSVHSAIAADVSRHKPEHGPVSDKQQSIEASHPAYAFLAKHGLLEHAGGLQSLPHDAEDQTLVMQPRRSRS